jgi:ABC-type lipoprotein export system ATPase subunit
VLGLFRRLHDGGQTIVMVTHDDEVAASADRIIHMLDGRIEDRSASGSKTPPAGGVFGVLGEEPSA